MRGASRNRSEYRRAELKDEDPYSQNRQEGADCDGDAIVVLFLYAAWIRIKIANLGPDFRLGYVFNALGRFMSPRHDIPQCIATSAPAPGSFFLSRKDNKNISAQVTASSQYTST